MDIGINPSKLFKARAQGIELYMWLKEVKERLAKECDITQLCVVIGCMQYLAHVPWSQIELETADSSSCIAILLFFIYISRLLLVQDVTAQEMANCDWLTSRHCADTFRNVTISSTGPNLDRFQELVYRPNCKHCGILGRVRD